MEDLQAELELAAEELNFWRDFAQWFRQKNDGKEGPGTFKLLEMLETAQRRYIDAEISTQTYVTANQIH